MRQKYLLDKAAVQGTEIASVAGRLAQNGGAGWEVNLTFTSEGAHQFAPVTGQLAQNQPPQNQFAIVLDGLVEVGALVNQAIIGGSAVITGSFQRRQEAKALANVLKYGSLPVSLEVSSVEQIRRPSADDQPAPASSPVPSACCSWHLYLVAYYRALGLVAVASLLVAAVITYGSFVILGRRSGSRSRSPGVAGAIVAIGITADSFVVCFERIRDEIREGRSLRRRRPGWVSPRVARSWRADFVVPRRRRPKISQSVGNVRGFAFTLGLTTVDVSRVRRSPRPLVSLLMRTSWFTSASPGRVCRPTASA